MSDLSECNYCTLQRMKEKAKQRNVEVVLETSTGEWNGWISVRYSDQEEISVRFKALTDSCVC